MLSVIVISNVEFLYVIGLLWHILALQSHSLYLNIHVNGGSW